MDDFKRNENPDQDSGYSTLPVSEEQDLIDQEEQPVCYQGENSNTADVLHFKEYLKLAFSNQDNDGSYLTKFLEDVHTNKSKQEAITLIKLNEEFGEKENLNITNRNKKTPLMLAVNSPEVLYWLLNTGADLDKSDRNGNNVFHFLAESSQDEHKQKQALNCLINCGMEFHKPEVLKTLLDAYNDQGYTPFCVAVHEENINMCRLLHPFVDVNKKNPRNGNSPLHELFLKQDNTNLEFLYCLLRQCGANVNAKTNSDITVLHCAAAKNDEDACKYLIQFGADKEIYDCKENTPIAYTKNANIAQMLRQ